MPIHDWSKVGAGIFHHFHHAWISSLANALNHGFVHSEYYGLLESPAGAAGPEERTSESEADQYARKANSVVVRHSSDHRVIAMVEIVSPGNKAGRLALRQFVEKAQDLLARGVHLLIIDLFPPGTLDPDGIHKSIWDYADDTFAAPPDRPLTLAAYTGGDAPEAFVEPTAAGLPPIDMPLFLTPDRYVPVPLEATYQTAWEAVPTVWRDVLEGNSGT